MIYENLVAFGKLRLKLFKKLYTCTDFVAFP